MAFMNGFKFLEAYQLLPLLEQQSIVILTTSLHEQDLARLYHLLIAEVLTNALTEAHLRDLQHRHFQWPQPVQPA